MTFYRAYCGVTNDEQTPDADKKTVKTATEELYEASGGTYCIFFSEYFGNDALLGIIADKEIPEEQYAREYCEKAGMTANSIRVCETTFKDICTLLAFADESGFIENDDELLSRFELKRMPAGRGNRLVHDESLITVMDRERIYSRATDLPLNRMLLEELDRIYACDYPANVIGHPVHYMINTPSEDLRKAYFRLLLAALYDNHRLKNRRCCCFTVEPDVPPRQADHESIYRSSAGGAVWIQYISKGDFDKTWTASAEHETVSELCKVIKKYKNRVLTVLTLPNDTGASAKIFAECLDSVCFVEVSENTFSGKAASDYLSSLAAEYKVTKTEGLNDGIGKEESYTLAELNATFEKWYDRKLKNTFFPQYRNIGADKPKHEKSVPVGSAYDKLMQMTGLAEAKKMIRKIIAYHNMQKLRGVCEKDANQSGMHMVFTGNPGTAKTTVARLFAQIMKENGILPLGRFVEVGRGDLVGKYVGWTANLVKEKFRMARGGVLFIDEAYSLVDSTSNSYGDEAINTIVQEMENNRGDVIVIFAGYPNEMDDFLKRNPGLCSRITFRVPFEDYTSDELCRIAESIGEENGLKISEDALAKMDSVFRDALTESDFGNGRYVRNLIKKAQMNLAVRIMETGAGDISESGVMTITADDIEPPTERVPKRFIGFA